MPDLQQQLQQLVSNDLPSLTSYYIEVSSEKGPGVLVVNTILTRTWLTLKHGF